VSCSSRSIPSKEKKKKTEKNWKKKTEEIKKREGGNSKFSRMKRTIANASPLYRLGSKRLGAGTSRFVSQISLVKNFDQIGWVRTVMTIISGSLSGILGITGVWGFLAFAILHMVVSLVVAVRMGDPSKYFPETTYLSFLVEGAGEQITLFIVFWALGYGFLWVF